MTDIHAPHPADCTCPECRPEPAAGDIVLARVPPRHGGRDRAAPTPCLVLGVADEGGERRLRLAPGAPAAGQSTRRGDLYATAEDLRGASLGGPHVFAAARPVLLPLGRGAGGAGGAAPTALGRLGGRALGRLEALRRRPAERACAPS